MINCEKCDCKLDDDEVSDMKRLALPQWCTECANAWALGDWDEKRIDVIGANGNDGLHYEINQPN